MKRLFFLFLLVFVAVGAWRISERLSADAISMALGVFLGVLAGIPVALMVLASARRREERGHEEMPPHARRAEMLPPGYSMPVQQPPVIVLAGHSYPQMAGQQGQTPPNQARMLPAPPEAQEQLPAARRFKVVGEQEEWIEEW